MHAGGRSFGSNNDLGNEDEMIQEINFFQGFAIFVQRIVIIVYSIYVHKLPGVNHNLSVAIVLRFN